MPYHVINEYPKSGGTWIGQMLARALDLPFPRNRLPLLEPSIMHGHFLHGWGISNPLLVWRDGRDVLVSWYYHSLFEHETNAPLVRRTRAMLGERDWDDVVEHLPRFMEYAFERSRSPRYSWAQFVDAWAARADVRHTHYESFRADAAGELVRVVSEWAGAELGRDAAGTIAEQHSFAAMSGRELGHEDKHSFLRKGVVGDWKRVFSARSRRLFHDYAGPQLRLLGYEADDSWRNATDD